MISKGEIILDIILLFRKLTAKKSGILIIFKIPEIIFRIFKYLRFVSNYFLTNFTASAIT